MKQSLREFLYSKQNCTYFIKTKIFEKNVKNLFIDLQEGMRGSRSSLQLSREKITLQKPGVAYPHHLTADPDPAFHLNADPDPLLIKVMGI